MGGRWGARPVLDRVNLRLVAGERLVVAVDDGYASYDAISGEQRKQIADKAQALADALDGIDPALGLSGL